MLKNDYLWKGILEHVFDDFLLFFFPEAIDKFDLKRGAVFLDKELADLFPDQTMRAPKMVDKLAKVFTKSTDGVPAEEHWFLVHIEVQGYKDLDFAKRMHTYFYRILDRYQKPVTALVIFTDTDQYYRLDRYQYEFLGTRLSFQFNAYKVIDQQEEALLNHTNPFAQVILTVLISLKYKKHRECELYKLKYVLLRNLYKRNFSPEKIEKLILFLQFYISFKDEQYTIKFEQAICNLTQNNKNMGIRELILEKVREEAESKGERRGERKGKRLGELQGRQKVVVNLLKNTQLSDIQIAEATEVSQRYVAALRSSMVG